MDLATIGKVLLAVALVAGLGLASTGLLVGPSPDASSEETLAGATATLTATPAPTTTAGPSPTPVGVETAVDRTGG